MQTVSIDPSVIPAFRPSRRFINTAQPFGYLIIETILLMPDGTGCIDFTLSPLVALWFACTNENINGKIIVLENDSEKIEEITTIEQLQQDLEVFFPIDQENWYLWSPILDSQIVETQRLIMQQSVFLFGLPEIDTEMTTQEITIRSDDKADIRTALEKIGISEQTLFSDLLGFFERNSATQPYNLSVDALSFRGTLL